MRAMPFALLLLSLSGTYFIVRRTTAIGDVPPLPACAAFVGVAGVCLLLSDIYVRIDRRLNQPPKPPYFVIDKTHGRCLELDADGTYESCQHLLSTLATQFNAVHSRHLEPGPQPDSDKGYWNVTIFGQQFFVMRHRGYGICVWGPKPPADLNGFLRIAEYFKAVEFVTWQRKLARFLRRRSSGITVKQAK
jgi:hypothetical protein